LIGGRCVRLFNVLDDFNREGLCTDEDFSSQAKRVICKLNQVFEWRGTAMTEFL